MASASNPYGWMSQLSSTAAYKPGGTVLPPTQELQFRQWAANNKITGYDDPDAHYDMRGYYLAQQNGDPYAARAANGHFPDTYKLPGHPSFSEESQYANGPAPHWQGDVLVSPQNKVIRNETPPKKLFSL